MKAIRIFSIYIFDTSNRDNAENQVISNDVRSLFNFIKVGCVSRGLYKVCLFSDIMYFHVHTECVQLYNLNT